MSSPNLVKARQALAVARERRRAAVESRTRGQRLAQMACSAPPTPAIQSFFRDVNTIHQARIRENHTQAEILDNMLRNLFVSESRRRYTATVISVCVLLALISLPCYKMLRRFFILPSYCTLWKHIDRYVHDNKGFVTEIALLPSFLQKLQEFSTGNVTEYGGFLAVDAISVRPHVIVTKDGFVEGVVNQTTVNESLFLQFQESLSQYESYLKTLRNKTITDSFVYQYQPINALKKSIVIFVEPSTQGKATSREIDRLSEIADCLEDAGMRVQGFSFDGDSTYLQLHRQFFMSYYSQVVSDPDFSNFSIGDERTVVSDPLHLLKRARYRLVGSKVHCGFDNTSDSLISVDHLAEQFDLPSVVFSDDKFTKMHDSLATRLFSLKNLAILLENRNFSVLSFFLPMCLLTASLQEPTLSVQERLYMLELGFFYMISYYGCSQEVHGPLGQRKSHGEKHIRAFDMTFVMEYCNTVFTIIRVLRNVNGTIALNRIGSNPVEHLFGLVRMKSRSVHTFDRMTRVLSKVVVYKKVLNAIGENHQIDKRVAYFAQDVDNIPSKLVDRSSAARDTAFSLHCVFGLLITVRNMMVWDSISAFELSTDQFENLRTTILHMARASEHKRKTQSISSSSVSPSSGTQILSRIAHRKVS